MATGLSICFDERRMDTVFEQLDQCQLPGAAVGVAIGGMPVYRKGFGVADMGMPTLLSPNMRMRIGSTSKHFTALAFMLLCEQGHAGIDDEVGRYLPGLRPVTARATMRQLMSHTSGIRDLLSISLLFNGLEPPVTDKQMLAYYETIDDADFIPGTRWSYNNGGYILLSSVIEIITGQALEVVLQERIFGPAGMHDTLLRRWDSDFVKNSATLHLLDPRGRWSRTGMGMEISGAGGIVSSVDDMLRWQKQMTAPLVGSKHTWDLMWSPNTLQNGNSTGYGLGLFTGQYRGAHVRHHAGTLVGGNYQMISVPEIGLDISIGVNRSDVSAVVLAQSVMDACVEGLDPSPRASVHRVRAGIFRSARDGRVLELSVSGGVTTVSLDGGNAVPVSADTKGVLQLPPSHAFLRQSVRVEADSVIHSDFGTEDRLYEISAAPGLQLGTRAGTYRCDAMDATLELSEDGDLIQARSFGRHGCADYVLTPIAEDTWRLEDCVSGMFTALVIFDPSGDGLTVDATRLRRVRFHRAGQPISASKPSFRLSRRSSP